MPEITLGELKGHINECIEILQKKHVELVEAAQQQGTVGSKLQNDLEALLGIFNGINARLTNFTNNQFQISFDATNNPIKYKDQLQEFIEADTSEKQGIDVFLKVIKNIHEYIDNVERELQKDQDQAQYQEQPDVHLEQEED